MRRGRHATERLVAVGQEERQCQCWTEQDALFGVVVGCGEQVLRRHVEALHIPAGPFDQQWMVGCESSKVQEFTRVRSPVPVEIRINPDLLAQISTSRLDVLAREQHQAA